MFSIGQGGHTYNLKLLTARLKAAGREFRECLRGLPPRTNLRGRVRKARAAAAVMRTGDPQ
jgi:hypothetical protein